MNDQSNECEVVYSPRAGEVISVTLKCKSLTIIDEEGAGNSSCTVKDVILQSNLLNDIPDIELAEISIGIWGHKVSLNDMVKAGDRIEIYRALKVDPKEARRLRYRKQGPVCSRHRPGHKGL